MAEQDPSLYGWKLGEADDNGCAPMFFTDDGGKTFVQVAVVHEDTARSLMYSEKEYTDRTEAQVVYVVLYHHVHLHVEVFANEALAHRFARAHVGAEVRYKEVRA